MARVTVEDCLVEENNRFRLILAAGGRAREIAFGASPLVAPLNDRPTGIALREIEEGQSSIAQLIKKKKKGIF